DDTNHYVSEDATATYDALNRMTSWSAASGAYFWGWTSPAASISYSYDANGNVRRTNATYHTLDAHGTISSSTTNQDYWYRYDSLNRLVVSRGVLSGGAIAAGSNGVSYSYTSTGQRVQMQSATATEHYYYDDADRLTMVRDAANVTRANYTYDLMG